ncbi:hypothetical protein Tco_0287436 [Tanacetum coccineum]
MMSPSSHHHITTPPSTSPSYHLHRHPLPPHRNHHTDTANITITLPSLSSPSSTATTLATTAATTAASPPPHHHHHHHVATLAANTTTMTTATTTPSSPHHHATSALVSSKGTPTKGVGLRVANSYTGNHQEDDFTPLETIRRFLGVVGSRSLLSLEGRPSSQIEGTSTSTHQQSQADFGSETRPPMLERGSYVPWSSRFMRYIDRKRETRKFHRRSIEEGPYQMKEIPATATQAKRTQNEDDLMAVLMTQSQPIESTQGTNRTPCTPRPPNPQEQQGELSAPKKPIIIRISKRNQPDPETPILIVEQMDVHDLDEATGVSIAIARSAKEYEAQQAVKKFVDDMGFSQEDHDTWIDPGSHKESPEAKKVAQYVSVDEELEEESTEAALIWRKGKGSLEIRNTPLTTPTRSPSNITNSLSSDKEKL